MSSILAVGGTQPLCFAYTPAAASTVDGLLFHTLQHYQQWGQPMLQAKPAGAVRADIKHSNL
jgi:hypothetical protein